MLTSLWKERMHGEMRRSIVMVLALVSLAPFVMAQHDDERADPGKVYKDIMLKELDLEEQLIGLAQLVKEHPRCIWADDALWALGELCSQKKRRKDALKYKLELVVRYPQCNLEPLTETLKVYRKSFIPPLKQAYREMGQVVARQGRRVAVVGGSERVHVVNPVLPAVHHDVALLYERQSDFINAARHYKKCLAKLPPEGYLTKFIQENYDKAKDFAQYQARPKSAKRKAAE